MVRYCPDCGAKNKDNSKYCVKCGKLISMDIHDINKNSIPSNKNRKENFNEEKQDENGLNKNILIIAIVIILCTGIIAGAVIFSSNNSSNQQNDTNPDQNQQNTDTNVNNPSSGSGSSSATAVSNLKIISGSVSTGSSDSDKAYCHVYVGSDHAGDSVRISALFSRDGNNLNEGRIVSTNVDSAGYVDVNSADGFKYYPDQVILTLYDGDGNRQDQKTVYLSATSGTQTF